MSAPIMIITPTRDRPGRAADLVAAWQATTEGNSTLFFGVDHDDPSRAVYEEKLPVPSGVRLEVGPSANLVEWTNRVALREQGPRIFGSWGDDHRPVGPWEHEVLDAFDSLGGTGVVATNDTVHGEAIPTACFMSADIVRALGWFMLPTCHHLFVDNAWRTLGLAAGCWRYLPRVIVRHDHPIVQRAEWDSTYDRGNSGEVQAHDQAAFHAWKTDGLAADAAKVRALRNMP